MTRPDEILEKPITGILSESFIDYSMSVIISRALPDVRDGLKPVHRRILYAMHELKMFPNSPFKKSARIVGEVIGKYHPHGDSAVYDAMTRLSQHWNQREILVNMHGNNGSIDGDGAAAMRYTEAKLHQMAMELLRDLDKDTVDFQDNYDGSEREPKVLPARIPNLLINGSEGIAVGMATKIPPHNLREVIHAVIELIDNPNATVEDLMKHIKGPDFPTGAMIMGEYGIKEAYTTGKGSIRIRGVAEIIQEKKQNKIVIREIPFQVNKSVLIEQIRNIQRDWDEYAKERTKKNSKVKPKGLDFCVRDGVEDHTGRDNDNNSVEIVITLKRDIEPELVLNYLYKHTSLQTTFNIHNLALVPKIDRDGKELLIPRILTLKETLEEYIKHQKQVETRRLEYDLKKKEEEIYLLAGLMKALDKMDETIETIRSSTSRNDAIERLTFLLSVSEAQAKHILERRLQTLANFEQDELRTKHDNIKKEIEEIKAILSDEAKIATIIKENLRHIADKYGKDRQTRIMPPAEDIVMEDLIPDDEVVVTMTQQGYIKRTLEANYRTQRRKGIGVNAMNMREDDFIRHLLVAKNHDYLLFFTNLGRVYKQKIYDIPELSANSKGKHINNILDLEQNETIQAVLSIREFHDELYLFFTTKNGIVKKSKLSAYANIRRNGIAAITLDNGDELVGASLTNGDRSVTLISKLGISITFKESDVKSVGRTGRGVKGISLQKNDEIVSFAIHDGISDLFIATKNGFGKRTPLSEYREQNRGGKGVIAIKVNEKNGEVIGTCTVHEDDTIMLITQNATLMKCLVKEISSIGRNTQGTKIINLRENDYLTAIARIPDSDEEETEEV